MSLYYDFHIHSALSPCGDNEMTPNNIINMSLIKGLDAIAVTDHNSALNVRACFECGKKSGIIVLPGMEIETCEEVHIVALFDNPDSCEELGSFVESNMPVIKNRVDIFGNQYVLSKDDEIVFEVENLLSTASSLDVESAVNKIRELGGVAIPAHVDKSSYSIISNLGFIPSELEFSTIEIKFPERAEELINKHNLYQYKLVHNSDAHFLWDIHEKEYFLDINVNSATEIINYLKQKKQD